MEYIHRERERGESETIILEKSLEGLLHGMVSDKSHWKLIMVPWDTWGFAQHSGILGVESNELFESPLISVLGKRILERVDGIPSYCSQMDLIMSNVTDVEDGV